MALPVIPVTAAAELARAGAVTADQDRILADEVVDGLRAAGFPRHFVPAEWGGGEGGFAALLRDVVEVGMACGSAAWYASLGAAVGRIAGYLPEEGRKTVWAEGPDVLLAGALVPCGRAERVPGGWRLAGRWPYVSAVEHAGYVLARGTAYTAGMGESRFFLLARGSWRTENTWRSSGMRATASNTLYVDDVVVPDWHTFATDDLVAGRAPEGADSRLRVPLRAINGLSFAAPMLGAARGALTAWWELTGDRFRGEPGDVEAALAVSRAESAVDTAGLLLGRVAAEADTNAVGERETLRSARDCALAAELLASAVTGLIASAGTRGQDEDTALQRFARDVHSAASHTMLRLGPAALAYARHLAAG